MAMTVIGAIVRALLIWLLLYIGLVHLFAVWSWKDVLEERISLDENELNELLSVIPLEPLALLDTSHVDSIPEEISPLIQLENKQTQQQLLMSIDEMRTSLSQWTELELMPLRAQQRDLEHALQELQSSFQQLQLLLYPENDEFTLWQNVESWMEQFQEEIDEQSIVVWDGDDMSRSADVLGRFLDDITDLSRLTSNEVDELFETILEAMDHDVKHAHTIRWGEFTATLRWAEYPLKTQSLIANCSSSSSIIETMPTSPPQLEITKHDVLERIDNLRTLWYQALEKNVVPVVLPTSLNRTILFQKELIHNWTIQVPKAKSPKNCLENLQQAQQILEAGIQALDKNDHLNRALLRALAELGVDPRTVILDAQLADDHDDRGVIRNATPLTWRQVLDRPLTKTLSHSFLPLLLDAIGGYNNAVDQWLDQNVPNEKQVYQQLLELAGQYPLPAPLQNLFLAK